MNIINAMGAINRAQAMVQKEGESAVLGETRGRIQTWLGDFVAEWYQPLMPLLMKQAARQVMAMPENARELLWARHPEGMRNVEMITKPFPERGVSAKAELQRNERLVK